MTIITTFWTCVYVFLSLYATILAIHSCWSFPDQKRNEYTTNTQYSTLSHVSTVYQRKYSQPLSAAMHIFCSGTKILSGAIYASEVCTWRFFLQLKVSPGQFSPI